MNSPSATNTPSVQITQAALLHLQKKLSELGGGLGLCVSIKKSGCSGYKYQYDFVTSPLPSTVAHAVSDNLSVFIPEEHSDFLKHITLDYGWHGINKSFFIINPNEKAKCGCGESVNL